MRRPSPALTAAPLLALALCTTSVRAAPEDETAAAGHTMTWRWPAGEPLVYTFTRVSEDKTPVPGKDPVYTRTIARRVTHEVVEPSGDVPEGVTAVRLTWEGIRFVNDDEVGDYLEYDSDKPHHGVRAHHPGIGMIASPLGTSVTYLMTPEGEFVGLEGHEGFLRAMELNLDRWGLADERTYENLQRMFTPVVLAESAEPLYRFVPPEPIAVGGAYEVSRVLTLPKVGIVRTRETHRLDRVETGEGGGRVAAFSVTGTVEWPEPEPEIRERFVVSINDSRVEGAWAYDLERGVPVSYGVVTWFNADVVHYDPSDRSTVEIPTVQTVTDRLELVEPGVVDSGTDGSTDDG